MAHHRSWRRGKSGLLAAFLLFFVLILFLGGSGGETAEQEAAGKGGRSDILELRLYAPGKPHQMPAAVFYHDRHTRALEDKDCGACHDKKAGDGQELVFSFRKAGEFSGRAAMEHYHEQCTGCHEEQKAASKKAGPLVENCRGCHRREPAEKKAMERIVFDRSLHFRHQSAEPITYRPDQNDKNCGACHHVYDEKAEELVYREGEEGSCRYCHKQQRIDDTRSYRKAAHADCVNCHRRLTADNIKAGPVECRGCHSAGALAEIEKIRDVPRLERGQPDAVLMAAWLGKAVETGKLPPRRTKAVAFDHLVHESAADTCRRCHHESLEACRKCHQAGGIEEGDFVTLARAMHQDDSGRSCIGCHGVQTGDPDCAGCHAPMPEKRFAGRDCQICHSLGAARLQPLPAEAERLEEIARSAVEDRPERGRVVDREDIPEKVNIDAMVDVYAAAQMPHRKIVTALADKVLGNRLAAVFHEDAATLCAGCHHNSPPDRNPPACASCHAVSEPPGAGGRPGLKGAYHGQCIGCHEQMGLEKPAATDCTACHEKREGSGAGPS